MKSLVTLLLGSALWAGILFADEAPIAGTIKAVDPAAQTVTLETTAKRKTREVTVDIKPTSKIIRFTRAQVAGKTAFVEQAATLNDLKPGWTISVTTKHDEGREVADTLKVVLER
ncbi:MAG TPA: hypothetical protein VNP04_26620 [Alphaproteobacteria bacterium]|nr:hypothetical protein [Alphaproteobacteria bacterium]